MNGTPIVLVHGAWHGGWAWDELASRLRTAGREVVAVDLPSSGPDAHTLGDLAADASVVRAALDAVDGSAVLVGHSYGGQVVSEASAGRHDVEHLVYVCAFMLDIGESLSGALGGEVPDWFELVADDTASRAHRHAEIFYADVADEVAAASSARLGLQSVSSFDAELTGAGWHAVASTYIICDQDQAIPPGAQEAMSTRAGAVHRLASSHSPFLSMPDRVAEIILGV
jgi:pimeloyl-ACP methyl ester carboxylesterase